MATADSISKFCNKCDCETERNARRQCKPCQKAATTVWRAANLEKVKATKAAWYAANRKKEKVANAAWYVANRERKAATTAAWKKANPGAVRINKHNRRALKIAVGGALSKGLSAKLFELQRGKCACCKLPLGDNLHMDHIMPLALGGANIDGNMQLLRATCNLKKHAKHPVDFMQSRGFLL